MEFYFSDSNIPRDKFLRNTIDSSEDGSILLSVFLVYFMRCVCMCYLLGIFVNLGFACYVLFDLTLVKSG